MIKEPMYLVTDTVQYSIGAGTSLAPREVSTYRRSVPSAFVAWQPSRWRFNGADGPHGNSV